MKGKEARKKGRGRPSEEWVKNRTIVFKSAKNEKK